MGAWPVPMVVMWKVAVFQVVFVGDSCVARLPRLVGARLCVVQLALLRGKGVLA